MLSKLIYRTIKHWERGNINRYNLLSSRSLRESRFDCIHFSLSEYIYDEWSNTLCKQIKAKDVSVGQRSSSIWWIASKNRIHRDRSSIDTAFFWRKSESRYFDEALFSATSNTFPSSCISSRKHCLQLHISIRRRRILRTPLDVTRRWRGQVHWNASTDSTNGHPTTGAQLVWTLSYVISLSTFHVLLRQQ